MKNETTKYAICTRCVMDTSDTEITFDGEGVCNHCRQFDNTISKYWYPNEEGERRLAAIVDRIKASGADRPYDSILGLSGGIDSSYLALKVAEMGLRPLVVHVDAGWNTELASHNIEAVVKHCGYELHTEVIDWSDMRRLQIAYLRSGVPNQDVPQDHIFFSSLYRFALDNGIRYVLSGGNVATESILPISWQASAMDASNLKDIFRKFGTGKLKNYKTISFWQYYIEFPLLRRMKVVRPLNYMNYVKSEALSELEGTVGYKPYATKHGESAFTRFFQNYYLPTRYGYDKRRPHYSSLINSRQMTRDEALTWLKQPLYDPADLAEDKAYIAKKLGMDVDELDRLIALPPNRHDDFATWDRSYKMLKSVQALMERASGRKIRPYS